MGDKSATKACREIEMNTHAHTTTHTSFNLFMLLDYILACFIPAWPHVKFRQYLISGNWNSILLYLMQVVPVSDLLYRDWITKCSLLIFHLKCFILISVHVFRRKQQIKRSNVFSQCSFVLSPFHRCCLSLKWERFLHGVMCKWQQGSTHGEICPHLTTFEGTCKQ